MGSSWDEALLRRELGWLKDTAGFEMQAIGWGDNKALAEFMAGPNSGLVDPDEEAPELPTKSIVRSGDLWTLGEHKILCGDSTKAEDVERLMGGEKGSS